jgi:hypothetical protein
MKGKLARIWRNRRIYKRVRDAVTLATVVRSKCKDDIIETVRSSYSETDIETLDAEIATGDKSFREVALGFIAHTRDRVGRDCSTCKGKGEYIVDAEVIEYLKATDQSLSELYINRAAIWCVTCQGTGWVRDEATVAGTASR